MFLVVLPQIYFRIQFFRLAKDFNNIVAIKEAAGDILQAMELINGVPSNFKVISGDDMLTLPMVLAGGSGVISVIGGGFPKSFSKMVKFGLERNVDNAYSLHYGFKPSNRLYF